MKMLDKYIKMFSNLRTAKDKKLYQSITGHRAPHKPLLLLSIMDLISQGEIKENFIEPSLELLNTFNTYYSAVMPPGSKTSMSHPFSRLQTDGFWHRVTKPGYDPEIEYNVKSMPRLREILEGARLDDELFHLLCAVESKEVLRTVLIERYFASEVRPLLLEQSGINYEAFEYSKLLLADPDRAYEEQKDKKPKARDQGFRKMIVRLYEHRCALCGIRTLTPEGHTVVDAAHIKAWSESNDDRATNGMALCRLCHWYFDEGLMSVGKKYEVLVSRSVQLENNLPGHVLTLIDRPIFIPFEEIYKPAQENFEYHRKKTFRTKI